MCYYPCLGNIMKMMGKNARQNHIRDGPLDIWWGGEESIIWGGGAGIKGKID